ncbi:MAG: tryptophan 7-halogenase, partial [Pirellulaceae bacterium]
SDVEALLARLAVAAGTPLLDRTEVALAAGPLGWRLNGSRDEQGVRIDAHFLIDATGEYGLAPRTLGIRSEPERLKTNSRTLFAHFADLKRWREILEARGGRTDEHPFDCDHAALHQVIDEGWMYQLRFNNGVTSAGFVLAADEHPLDPARPIQHEWDALLARYPDLAEQFRSARVAAPAGGLVRTGRLQRRHSQLAGPNWALLPHTAGFIDPLHSTGIAQSLCGIQRLAQALEHHWQSPSLEPALRRYEAALWRELDLIDQLVSACYLARRTPRLFAACTMLYFAAAHTSETRRLAGKLPPGEGFLCADDPRFRSLVQQTWQQVHALSRQQTIEVTALQAFETELAAALGPYNTAGLLDPSAHNLYRCTQIDKGRLAR